MVKESGMDRGPWSEVSRRRLFTLGGGVIAAARTAPAALAATGRRAGGRAITVSEGTNIAVAASPDGRTLAMDLYGVLWLLPIEGGKARRLTEDVQDLAQPDWSPDGRRLAFQSYRDGNFHVWMVDVDGSDLRQLTTGPFDSREPRFSPDGKRIAFSSDRGGGYGVHVLDVATGAVTALTHGPTDEYEPAWSSDGQSVAFTVDHARIDVIDAAGVRRTVAQVKPNADRFAPTSVGAAAFTPDGRDVIYTRTQAGRAELLRASGATLVAGEDVFPFRVAWLPGGDFVYAADGKIRRRNAAGEAMRPIAFSVATEVTTPAYVKKRIDYTDARAKPVVGIGAPALSPDGRSVAFRALNDLYAMTIGEAPRPLMRDGFYKVDPAWSPDGRTLAYSTDRGGSFDLWLRDMATGEDRQLTHFKDAALSPAWSRDGKQLAFLSQTGGLFLADVATGGTRRLYEDLWEPGKPSWSPDGRTIAYAAFKPYSARFREGLSEILTVDVNTGKGAYQPILPNQSIGTRGDDGPVWSPDGKTLALVFASRLWLAPVDVRGKLSGEPKPINDEVTDAPTWSGDSAKLLYLSAGSLRMIAAAGGAPVTVPMSLTWANAKPPPRSVVRAGRLWDGTSPAVRRDVEVVIEGGRIAGVAPTGAVTDANARRIDASTGFVMPGLVDMHTHRQMQGYGYGDREGRLWLSLGVTTTRCPGAPAYHTVEDREAINSGARVGPRYYTTGEAIDGSRIFYNFMRPVTETGQMALELKRAEALNYDLIKTYVRLPVDKQRAVMEWAHAHGMHATSHYHMPALAFGMDGMEHLGATARTGYSRTVSALGNVYEDVGKAFLATGAPRTPTLFISTVLFAEDRSLVDDRRIKTLYPPWEYARLLDRAKQMTSVDREPLLASLKNNVAQIRDTIRGGGVIISGTDSPIDFNAVSLHMNLRAMVRFGLTPYEALVTATRASGEFLDEPLGLIRKGAFADLLVSSGDPLTRIEDAAQVSITIKNGEVFTPEDLMRPFAAHMQTAQATPRGGFACTTSPEYWWHGAAYLDHARNSCCDGGCASQWRMPTEGGILA